MLFSHFFERLSKEFNQTREFADSSSEYQYLDAEEAIDETNDTIKELVELNPLLFKEEYKHIFNAETTTFRLPEIFHKILGYYDSITGEWKIPSDASDMTRDLRTIGDRTISVITPWQKGDELLLRVSKWPPDIESESDTVPFPVQHLRFLRLEIIRNVLGTKGKNWPELMQQLYNDRLNSYRLAGNSIQRSMKIRKYGARFGE